DTPTVFGGDLRGFMLRSIAPCSEWSDMGRSEHFVQFYESDEFIMNSVAEYIVHGLKSGEASIVLASREHLAGIREGVEMLSVGLGDASLKGKYIALDAHKTLN